VAKFVWLWCQGLVFFPVTSQFFLVDDIPGKGMDDNGVSFGESVFRQKQGRGHYQCLEEPQRQEGGKSRGE